MELANIKLNPNNPRTIRDDKFKKLVESIKESTKFLEAKPIVVKDGVVFGGNYFLDFLPASDGWLIWDKRGDTGIRNTFADGEMAWCSFHTTVRIYKQLWNGMIREGEHDKRVHPTQKPVEGDIVLDLFGGSGSTLIACEQLNRTCYMMEIDPKYCDVIRKRYAKFIGKENEWLEVTPVII